MRTFTIEAELEAPVGATSWMVTAGGAWLALRTAGRIEVFATEDLVKRHDIESDAFATAAVWALSPNGADVALAEDRSIIVLVADRWVSADVADGLDTPIALAWTPDGSRLWGSSALGEDPRAEGTLVTHVFELAVEDGLGITQFGWVRCDLEEQSHRIVPDGERCLFTIGCGQDGTWVYRLGRPNEKGDVEPAELLPGAELCEMCGFTGDVAIGLAPGRIVRVGADLALLDEAVFPDGMELAGAGAMMDDLAFVPVAPVARAAPISVLAYDVTTGALVGRGDDLGAHFLGAAPGGRVLFLEPRPDGARVRLYRLSSS